MSYKMFLGNLTLSKIEEEASKILETINDFMKPIIEKISNFISSQNPILIVAILTLAVILILVGLTRMLNKKPGLLLLIVVILGIIVGISYILTLL